MKYLFATMAVLATISAAAAMPGSKQNYTPRPDVHKAGCVAYQVCQTCTGPNGNTYPCGCHMECLPGIH
jgi:hypothetical protein